MSMQTPLMIMIIVVSISLWSATGEFSMEVSLSVWCVCWIPVSVKSGIMTNVSEEKPGVKTWESQGERCERKAWMDEFSCSVCEARDKTDRKLHCYSFLHAGQEWHILSHSYTIGGLCYCKDLCNFNIALIIAPHWPLLLLPTVQVKWAVTPVSTDHTLKIKYDHQAFEILSDNW